MSEYEDKPKQPTASEILSNVPRKDTYSPEHGGGDPHTNWDDKPLSESETWKSHKSSPATEQKSHGTKQPKKK
jgi:hypothetical protein